MVKNASKVLVTLAVAALMTSGAQGFLVSNVTDGTILFSDNFENVLPGEAPNPTVGTWMPNLDEGGPAVVTDADFYNGAQCLQNPSRGEQIADFGPPDNETGDQLQMQFAFKDDGGASYITLGLYADDTKIVHIQFLDEASPDLGWGGYYDNAGSLVVSGGEAEYLGVVNTDDWNTIVIDYVNGATDFSWSINGGATETWNVQTPGILDKFNIFGRTAPTLFDDIPEPATLSLLSLGGLALIRRRRR